MTAIVLAWLAVASLGADPQSATPSTGAVRWAETVDGLRRAPDEWGSYRALVDVAMIANETAAATSLLQSRLAQHPSDARPRVALAILARRQERWQDAMDLLAPLVGRNDAPLLAFREYLESARAVGHIRQASATMAQRPARLPRNARLQYAAGYSAGLRFDWPVALTSLHRSWRLDATVDAAHALAAAEWEAGHPEACISAATSGLTGAADPDASSDMRTALLLVRSMCAAEKHDAGTTAIDLDQALERTGSGRDLTSLAAALQAKGRYENNAGRPGEAIGFYDRALDLHEKLGEQREVAVDLVLLSFAYPARHPFVEKLPLLDRALAISERLGDTRTAVRARGTRGSSLMLLGRHAEARRDLLDTYADAVRIGAVRAQAANAGNLSELFTELGDLDRARAFAGRALSAYRRAGSPDGEAQTILGLGDLALKSGDRARGLAYHSRATTLFRDRNDRLALRGCLLRLGRDYELRGDWRTAERYYRESLDLSEAAEQLTPRALAHAALADVARKTGRGAVAADEYQIALSLGSGDEGALALAVQANHGLGLVRRSEGRRDEAIEHFRIAIAHVEAIRADTDLGELRMLYFADKHALYVDAIDTLVELDRAQPGHGHAESAFELAERIKARSLRDILAGSDADASAGVSASSVASRLADGDLLLQFVLGGRRSYLFTLDRTGALEIDPIPPRARIERAVADLRAALSHRPEPGLLEPSLLDIRQRAHLLSRFLIQPAAARLRSARRIIVVADGALWHVPFAVLPSTDGSRYLAEQLQIVTAASAALFTSAPAAASATTDFVGFGDPLIRTARSNNGADELTSLERAGFSLAPLPGSAAEIARIARLFPQGRARRVTGRAFTERAVIDELRQPHRFVHFASHAVIDERVPARSGIVMSRTAGEEDGMLDVRELQRLRISADLMTLSACQTGLGRLVDGEGVAGLASAFQRAGVRSLLVTLWNVSDAASPLVMLSMYKALLSGAPKAAALQTAWRTMIHNANPVLRHPYYWGAYSLTSSQDSGDVK